MKKIILLTTIIALFVILFSSCMKYEKGPVISFRTKAARMSNEWVLNELFIANGDGGLVPIDGSYTEYKKDGTGAFYDSNGNATELEWEFGDYKTQYHIRLKDGSGNWGAWGNFVTIIKLKNDELWYRDTNGWQYHYITR